MRDTDRHDEVAVVGPLDAARLASFEALDGPADAQEEIGSLLRGVAEAPGGRVALGLAASRVVAFLGLVPPAPEDRFYAVPSAVEVAAVRVAEPYRRRGVCRRMFEVAAGPELEDRILYVLAEPSTREAGESVRGYRERVTSVFGSLGFFPYPSRDVQARLGRDAVVLVRIGRGVPTSEVESFFERLGRPDARISVAVFLRDGTLRNLVRTDLERHDFDVVSVAATPSGTGSAEVVITEFTEPTGGLLTVRVVRHEEAGADGSIVRQPVSELDRLPDVLREQMARRRNRRWLRSSRNGA